MLWLIDQFYHSCYKKFVATVTKLMYCVNNLQSRTAVDCVNNLQSLMKSCRDISNKDTYDEIYQKAADMVSPEEISTYATYCKTSNDA